MTTLRRVGWAFFLLAVLLASKLSGTSSRQAVSGTVVIAVGAEATTPVPTIPATKANTDVMGLLFLPLARMDTSYTTIGDQSFTPILARSWARRDSVTLVFELHPGARWHDGVPVTSRDFQHTLARIRTPGADPQTNLLTRFISELRSEGPQRLVVSFSRAYPEQFYDVISNLIPLPAHLVDTIPSERFAASRFAQSPVGNGPYRWVGRIPGRQVELSGNPDFFLGKPGINRVIFLLARDPDAQLNLLLDGTADALENVSPPSRVRALSNRGSLRVVHSPTYAVGYLLFNQRAYGDRSRPHPILAELTVRQAIAMTLDRESMLRLALGGIGGIPEGPVASLHWIRSRSWRPAQPNPEGARAILERAGWTDSNGDGILDRNGLPMILRLQYPGTNAIRSTMAAQVQEQLRHVGIRIELVRLDGPVWLERRNRGEFDIDFSQAGLMPSPSGLVQSWSCAGRSGSNVAQYCNPRIDSLMDAASQGLQNPLGLYREVIKQIEADAPAVFIFSLDNATAVHTRFQNITFPAESWWSSVWTWSIKPGRALPRDRPASSSRR